MGQKTLEILQPVTKLDSWNQIEQILTLCWCRNRWGYNASFFFIRRWDGNYLQALIKEGKLFFVIVPTLWVHREHNGFTDFPKLQTWPSPFPKYLILINSVQPILLSICTWFLNSPVWNIKFDELDFFPSLNWIFLHAVACKSLK